ncbi:MAG: hypothetical protein ABI867_12940 [Kofleriaceae bacterium]
MKHLVLACLLACGGKSTTPATMATVDCKAAVAKVVSDTTVQDKTALTAGLEARCQSDAWSNDARACLAEKGEAGPCALTDKERAGIEQERAKVVAPPAN